jgi:hypothetical protein
MKSSVQLNQPTWLIIAIVVLAGLVAWVVMSSHHQTMMMTMPSATPVPVTVQLSAQNNSGESGTATLMAMGNQTKVIVKLTGAPMDIAQPAHIHKGTCANLDPNPTYPLTDIKGGASETVVDASLASLMTGNFSINVHKSMQEISTYVACGTIPKG